MVMVDLRRRIASDKDAAELHSFARKVLKKRAKSYLNNKVLKNRLAYTLPEKIRLRDAIRAGAEAVLCAEMEKRAV